MSPFLYSSQFTEAKVAELSIAYFLETKIVVNAIESMIVIKIIATITLVSKLKPLICLFSQIMFVGSVAAVKFTGLPSIVAV